MQNSEVIAICKGSLEKDAGLAPLIVADYIEDNDCSEYGAMIAKQLRNHDGAKYLVKWFANGTATYGLCNNHILGCDEPILHNRNTKYECNESNYQYCCQECQRIDNELLQELWNEYNRGRL